MRHLKQSFLLFFLFLFSFLGISFARITPLPENLKAIPIQDNGRRKPYLVFSQETLRSLCGKTQLSSAGENWSAMGVMTDLWLNPQEKWAERPLILISNHQLKQELGLPLEEKLFSAKKLHQLPRLKELAFQADAARKKNPKERLHGLLKEANDVQMRLTLFDALESGVLFRVIPNPAGAAAGWLTLPAWQELGGPGNLDQGNQAWQMMLSGWNENRPSLFSQGVDLLEQAVTTIATPDPLPPWKLSLEVTYQELHPFRWAWILYALAGMLLLLFHDVKKETRQRKETPIPNQQSKNWGYPLAWSLAGTGFALQLSGLVARVLISGRPPVTNMYESMIWVAFGTILFSLIFESIYGVGTFLLGAIPVAVASLIVADSQPMILDQSIQPLTPVLRDNFWLTIHVLTITLSYAAFALSLGIAHIVMIVVLQRKKPTASLYNYLYRALQVGVLLLATGTLLGGVWANYSWGRFWDWDPKETWALIALLGYLFLLHGRIAGRWGGFGLSVGAILAFLGVLMAWYGVNFVLGTGMHSYGFGTGGFPWVLGFVALEVLLVIITSMRYRKLRKS